MLIGDHEVIEVTADAIRIKTASGALQSFYKRPEPNFGLAYRERIKMAGEDSRGEEVRLRAVEAVVNLYRNHHPSVDFETAKRMVTAAIAAHDATARPKEKA